MTYIVAHAETPDCHGLKKIVAWGHTGKTVDVEAYGDRGQPKPLHAIPTNAFARLCRDFLAQYDAHDV